jgi:hypothetical protein
MIGTIIATIAIFYPDALVMASGRGELAKVEKEARDLGPRLDISYLFLANDYVGSEVDSPTATTEPPRSNEAKTRLSFRTIETEVPDPGLMDEAGCRMGDTAMPSEVYLVVINEGNRDAKKVTVHADQIQLAAPALIRKAAVGGREDYVAKLRGAAPSTPTSRTFEIPTAIAPGDGRRIPLWISVTPPDNALPWCVVSRIALLPTKVTFMDPGLDPSDAPPPIEVEVRPIKSPERLEYGVHVGG